MRDRLSVLWSVAGAAALAVMLGIVAKPAAVIRCADPDFWCVVFWWCNC